MYMHAWKIVLIRNVFLNIEVSIGIINRYAFR